MGAYADPAGMEETMKDVYKRFPRLEERRRQLAGTLSGGEQQMLAVGRALMAKPKMILMDEPSMGLSPLLVKEIFAIIQEVNKQGITILLVEQNAKMALAISDRAYVLETGNISIEGQRRGSAERPAREESLSGPVRRGWKMYPNYPYFAVAITRTCGSGGGSYIGKQLAKAFDIDLYDRKLLRLASEDSGISEELFAHADENTRKTMLYRVSERVYDGSIIPPESGNFISDENLFNYQAKVLRELLNEESYICVGRAADFVLRDKPNVLTVYVDAPYDWRVEREMKRQGIGSGQAKHYIDKLDRYRESYYKYHTGRQWKRVENYDLCLDSAAIGLDNCVELIKKVIELKFDVKAK